MPRANQEKRKINELKRSIVRAAHLSGEAHIASAFSILDILWTIYDKVLRINPKHPREETRDRFFLSKGHGSLALYAVLTEKGFLDKKEMEQFCKFDGILGGHPDRNKVPGVEASTGSLGHGFPMAVGAALALKIKGVKARVFSLIGDGECNEGTIWESALLAAHHRLGNLSVIVDHNHSTDRALRVDDLVKKFSAFGWESARIDGHDRKAIERALKQIGGKKPLAVVAETVKGKGVKMMERNPEWHHKAPNKEELEKILNELL